MSTFIETDAATGATIVSHDYPSDTPVALVLDCSAPSPQDVDAIALLEQGLALVRAGDVTGGTEAIQTAQQQLAASTTARIVVNPYTDAEIAQQQADQQTADVAAAAAAQAAADQQALVDKLTSGTASTDEVQQALAQLLGGPQATS